RLQWRRKAVEDALAVEDRDVIRAYLCGLVLQSLPDHAAEQISRDVGLADLLQTLAQLVVDLKRLVLLSQQVKVAGAAQVQIEEIFTLEAAGVVGQRQRFLEFHLRTEQFERQGSVLTLVGQEGN